MGESLWHDLDAWQVNIINEAMGMGSDYATLKLKRVAPALRWNAMDWQEWPKPGVAVISFSLEREGGPHGDGDAHLTKQYHAIWLALTEGTEANSIRDAKILVARMEALLRDLFQQGFTLPPDDFGERLVNLYLGRGEITNHRLDTHSDDLYMTMAGIALRWETEV